MAFMLTNGALPGLVAARIASMFNDLAEEAGVCVALEVRSADRGSRFVRVQPGTDAAGGPGPCREEVSASAVLEEMAALARECEEVVALREAEQDAYTDMMRGEG